MQEEQRARKAPKAETEEQDEPRKECKRSKGQGKHQEQIQLRKEDLTRKLIAGTHREAHQRNFPGRSSKAPSGNPIAGTHREAHQRNPPGAGQ